MSNRLSAVTIAWLITAVYYFFQVQPPLGARP